MVQIIPDISRTFDDFLLLPWETKVSDTLDSVTLETVISRFNSRATWALKLKIPLVSAAMQSVSWPKLAISLAREGWISFIYCSQTIEQQVQMIREVKNFKAGFIQTEASVSQKSTWLDIKAMRDKTWHSTIPITEDWSPTGKLVWIITSRDCRWLTDNDNAKTVRDFMTPLDKLITWTVWISLSEANKKIIEAKIDCLPIIDNEWNLHSMVFYKDIQWHKEYPLESLDNEKRLLVGAWINSRDYKHRVPALIEAGADILCLDSSDGFSHWQAETIKWIKETFWNHVLVWAWNVVDSRGFDFLVEAGADFVKIWIWWGAICTTRETKWIWRGQASAVLDVSLARDTYYEKTWIYIPICSDGWIVHNHHITFALAMWADFVMMGRYFAGTKEAPWKLIEWKKEYWWEWSPRAQSWNRYDGSMIPEWVDAYIPYIWELSLSVRETLKLIRTTMANNIWVTDLKSLRNKAVFTLVSDSTRREWGTDNVIVKK